MPRTEGETGKAPGLKWRKRRDGSQAAYWVARPALVKAGYRPKSVRLHYERHDPALVARCHVLQAEMVSWAQGGGHGMASKYDGTFASLVRLYETHPDSPYHELRSSQRQYSKAMELLMRHKGERRVDAVDGSDVRRWYLELVKSHSKGWAYYTINVLKAVLSFGATKRIQECRILRAELREAKFSAGKRRKEYLTYEQVRAFCDAAHEAGYHWMALCLTLQFDFGLRRRDVIGEYVTDEGATAEIKIGRRIWRDGITWKHIDEHGVFRKLVSKTALTSEHEAIHVIGDYPDVERELSRFPIESRIGPVVINHKTGLPPTEAQCRRIFRRFARKVGIPDNVWNMDARAGANTEAFNSGATADERMALLTHSQADTNEGYIRNLTTLSRSAAAKRVQSRKG